MWAIFRLTESRILSTHLFIPMCLTLKLVRRLNHTLMIELHQVNTDRYTDLRQRLITVDGDVGKWPYSLRLVRSPSTQYEYNVTVEMFQMLRHNFARGSNDKFAISQRQCCQFEQSSPILTHIPTITMHQTKSVESIHFPTGQWLCDV